MCSSDFSSWPSTAPSRELRGTVALTLQQFTYGFANNPSPAEAKELYATYAMPSPGRPLFQAL